MRRLLHSVALATAHRLPDEHAATDVHSDCCHCCRAAAEYANTTCVCVVPSGCHKAAYGAGPEHREAGSPACVDMCMDMCTDRHVYRHVYRHVARHVHTVAADRFADRRTPDTPAAVRQLDAFDVREHDGRAARTDLIKLLELVDIDRPAYGHVYRHTHGHVYRHPHGYVYRHTHGHVYRHTHGHACRRACKHMWRCMCKHVRRRGASSKNERARPTTAKARA